MSSPSPIQARAQEPDIRQSTSFSKHLKGLERKIPLRARYENFIGGKWVAPVKGGYFDNVSPTTGQVICQIAALPGRGCRARARCGARGRRQVGTHRGRRARPRV